MGKQNRLRKDEKRGILILLLQYQRGETSLLFLRNGIKWNTDLEMGENLQIKKKHGSTIHEKKYRSLALYTGYGK